MDSKWFTAHIFRRHQCQELGWEWRNSIGAPTQEQAANAAKERIGWAIDAYPVPITRSRFKFIVCAGKFDEAEEARVAYLRKINEPFMSERAKWPKLVEPLPAAETSEEKVR